MSEQHDKLEEDHGVEDVRSPAARKANLVSIEAQLLSELGELKTAVGGLNQSIGYWNETVDHLKKELFGNGQPGKLDRIEIRLSELERLSLLLQTNQQDCPARSYFSVNSEQFRKDFRSRTWFSTATIIVAMLACMVALGTFWSGKRAQKTRQEDLQQVVETAVHATIETFSNKP